MLLQAADTHPYEYQQRAAAPAELRAAPNESPFQAAARLRRFRPTDYIRASYVVFLRLGSGGQQGIYRFIGAALIKIVAVGTASAARP